MQSSHGRGISREAREAMLLLLYGDRLADGRVYKATVKKLTQRREQASDCCRCKKEVRLLVLGSRSNHCLVELAKTGCEAQRQTRVGFDGFEEYDGGWFVSTDVMRKWEAPCYLYI